MNILRLIAELGIDATGFNRGMDSAKTKAQQSGQAVGAAFKSTFVRFLGAAAIIAHIRNIAREIDNIEDSAQRLGISTEQFQKMSIAAERAGQSLQGSKGIGRVFNELAELRAKAEGGDIKAMTALNNLGLSMLGAADDAESLYDAFSKVIELSDSKLSEVFGGKLLLDIKAFREELSKVKGEAIYSDEQIIQIKKADETFKSLFRTVKVGTAELIEGSIAGGMRRGGVFGRGGILHSLLAPFAGNNQIGLDENIRHEALPEAKRLLAEIRSGERAPNPRLEAIQRQRGKLEEQLRVLQQRAAGRSGGGMDVSNIIGTVAARFGARQALISTAEIREKQKPIPPELKQSLTDITNLIRMLVQEEKNLINFK